MRKIAENYKLPYYTLSPTYSICKNHGYMTGEHYTCDSCGEKAEVYSRITGYYRPVQNWNDGKLQEFKERKTYDINSSHLKHAGVSGEQSAETSGCGCEECGGETEILLFASKTCPNCKRAAEHLDKAGIPYRKIICEENEEEAVRYGVRLAPTLIVVREGTFDKYANASNIIKYIEEATVKA